MLKKGNPKVRRPRKKSLQNDVTAASWKMGLEIPADCKESKITFYFRCGTDHSYAKKIYFPTNDIGSTDENVHLPGAAKKKLNKKSALTACNVSNFNGVMRKPAVKSTGLTQEKKAQTELRNKQLTDYFPVRRSVRKTSVTIKKEKQKEIEERILSGREDGYEVREFIGKGRGIVSIHPVKRGDFVLEYSGDLISVDEAKRREQVYSHDENIGCYMYYFTHKNRQYCVDATRETGRLGRLVNHSKKSNLKTKSVLVQDIPRLILVAERDILPGEELLYDYGDRSKRSLESHPWLAL